MTSRPRRLSARTFGWLAGAALVAGAVTSAQAAAVLFPIDWTPFHIQASPDFIAHINGEPTRQDVAIAVVMPGQSVRVAADRLSDKADLVLDDPAGQRLARRPLSSRAAWRWRAPDTPGVYQLTLRNRATTAALHIQVFVETPFDISQTELAGYHIGQYQSRPRHDNPIYAPPKGLIRVTPAMADIEVAPGLYLGDFLCHQQPEQWPKFLRLEPRLLTKLQAITQAVRATGIRLDALTVMSGYRTPWYNQDIGNTTVYSRHLYGGAADIFVDTTGDGDMDDLNADGVIDVEDARWLAQLIEQVDDAHPAFAGGLSAYPGNAFHGPFVHVDVRGTAIRW